MKRDLPAMTTILKTFIVFFTLAIFSSLEAQTYVLNPENENLSSMPGLPLSKANESLWLKNFYRRVPLLSNTIIFLGPITRL